MSKLVLKSHTWLQIVNSPSSQTEETETTDTYVCVYIYIYIPIMITVDHRRPLEGGVGAEEEHHGALPRLSIS